ncbi:hypothetical protein [Nannocystis sp.]|nr:hypothetical protein [Nannocystis sp.]
MFCPQSLVVLVVGSLALLQAAREPELPVVVDVCGEAPRAASDPRLAGLWQRFETLHEGDPMRFYFFHPDGFGIYRYGKVGLTNTHSFDFEGSQGALGLRFRKSGAEHTVAYRFETDGEREWLVLRGDPREATAEVRYFRAGNARAHCFEGALLPADLRGSGAAMRTPAGPGPQTGALGGRLWGDEQRFATGGSGFSIYQLQVQALDGRGVGWHHRGDYDEWTTESLVFRQQGERLGLQFPLRHESQATTISLEAGADQVRVLTLAEDPRDFWRPHAYRDLGPGFTDCAEGQWR